MTPDLGAPPAQHPIIKPDPGAPPIIIRAMAEVICESEGYGVNDDNVNDLLATGRDAYIAALKLVQARANMRAFGKALQALIDEVETVALPAPDA